MVDAGDYTITATGKGNYTGSVSTTYRVIKANNNSVTVIPNNTQDYNGIVYDGAAVQEEDFTVTKPDDYTGTPTFAYSSDNGATWSDMAPTNAGSYKVKVTFPADGNFYSKTIITDFTIAKRKVTVSPKFDGMVFGSRLADPDRDDRVGYNIQTQTDNEGFIGTPAEYEFGEKVFRIGKEISTTNVLHTGLADDFDYDNYSNDAGTYEYVTGEDFKAYNDGNNNYTLVYKNLLDAVFTVSKADLNSSWFTANAKTYNGSEQNFSYTASHKSYDQKNELLTANDYEVTGVTSATNAGTYTAHISASGNSNYVNAPGTNGFDISWTIAPAQATDFNVADVQNVVYNGANDPQTITVTGINDAALKQGMDYDYELAYVKVTGEVTNYEALFADDSAVLAHAKEAGKYVVRVNGYNNYVGNVVYKEFEITNATADPKHYDVTFAGKTYNGQSVADSAFTIAANSNANTVEQEAVEIKSIKYFANPANSLDDNNSKYLVPYTSYVYLSAAYTNYRTFTINGYYSSTNASSPINGSFNMFSGDMLYVDSDGNLIRTYYNSSTSNESHTQKYYAKPGKVWKLDGNTITLVDDPGTPTNAGSYLAIMTVGGENINDFRINKYFKIDKATVTVTLGHDDITWGQLLSESDFIRSTSGIVEGETINFTGMFTALNGTATYSTINASNNAVGTYTIGRTARFATYNNGNNNYTLVAPDGSFKVKAKSLADDDVTITIASKTYNGSPVNLSSDDIVITVPYKTSAGTGSYKLKPDDYTRYGPSMAIDAGSFTETFDGEGNFTGEKDAEWVVNTLDMTIEHQNDSSFQKFYDGTPFNMSRMFTAKISGTENAVPGAQFEYLYVTTAERNGYRDSFYSSNGNYPTSEELYKHFDDPAHKTAPTDAGSYYVFVKVTATNYTTTYTDHPYYIHKATGVTITPTETALTAEYGSTKKVTVTFKVNGLVNGEAVEDITVDYDISNLNASTDAVTIEPTLSDAAKDILKNYEYTTTNADLTITKQSLIGATVTVNKKALPEGGKVTFTKADVTVTDKYGNIVDPSQYDVSDLTVKKPGTNPIVVVAKENVNYKDYVQGTAEAVERIVTLKGRSISIEEGMFINYLYTINDEALADEGAYVHFTSDGGIDQTVLLADGILVNGMYSFACAIQPDHMRDEITATVYYSDNTVASTNTGYSMLTYANNMKIRNASNESVVNLMNAVLNYGAASQKFSGYDTDNLVYTGDDFDADITIGDSYQRVIDNSADGITIIGASMVIDANISLNVMFKLNDADLSDYTITCTDTLTNKKVDIEVLDKSSYYQIVIPGVTPKNYDTNYRITIENKNETKTTVDYSVFAAIKSLMQNTKTTATTKELLKSMYYLNVALENLSL